MHSWVWIPVWFIIYLPAGLVGGVVVSGGIPWTPLHWPGGFYWGLVAVLAGYAFLLRMRSPMLRLNIRFPMLQFC